MLPFFWDHILVYWTTSLYLTYQSVPQPLIHPLHSTLLVVLSNQVMSLCFIPWSHCIYDDTKIFHCQSAVFYGMFYYVVTCILFYFIHFMFHRHRYLWKTIHYMHHLYQTPLPWMAFFCHPIEHIVLNILPVVIGPWLLPSDLFTVRTWFILCTMSSVWSHAFDLCRPHSIHHMFVNGNYGIGSCIDKICVTYIPTTDISS